MIAKDFLCVRLRRRALSSPPARPSRKSSRPSRGTIPAARTTRPLPFLSSPDDFPLYFQLEIYFQKGATCFRSASVWPSWRTNTQAAAETRARAPSPLCKCDACRPPHFARFGFANPSPFTAALQPGQFTVVDSDTGAVIARLPCVLGVDDLWYDAARKRIYAPGFQQIDADHYAAVAHVAIGVGSGSTSLHLTSRTRPRAQCGRHRGSRHTSYVSPFASSRSWLSAGRSSKGPGTPSSIYSLMSTLRAVNLLRLLRRRR
jgi:hypothetical protein